jgi:tRNA dimethylallyltransferase
MAHLNGEMSLDEAAALGVRDTKAYAKRQFTWARHQLPGFQWVAPEEAEAYALEIAEPTARPSLRGA